MFQNIKSKIRKHKSLCLLPLLFLLSGCTYVSELDGTVQNAIFATLTSMKLDNMMDTNKALIYDYGDMVKQISGVASGTFNLMDSLGTSLSTIVTTVTILAVALILIKFAWSVFKDNMYEQNRDMAPDIITRIKKVIVAIAITFAIPYICITSFSAATVLGNAVANVGKEENQEVLQVYQEMEEQNLSFSTYCLAGLNDWKKAPANSSQKINYIPVYEEWTPLLDKWRDVDKTYWHTSEEYPGDPLYIDNFNDKWCPGWDNENEDERPNNIYEALFDTGKKYGDQTPYKYENNLLDNVKMFILKILIWFITFFAMYCSAKRIVELIFLIATSWWYIGGSVGDTYEESSLQTFGKKLLNICLSQFFLIYEFGIFITVIGMNMSTSMVLAIAFILVMVKTPSAVAEMVSDTGTSKQALAISKNIAGKVGLIK